MSMSDIDEIDGYDPTTPYKPVPANKKRKLPDSSGAPSNAPSKPASKVNATATTSKARKATRPSPETLPGTDDEDGIEALYASEPEAPPAKASKPAPAKVPPSRAQAKGKKPEAAPAKINGASSSRSSEGPTAREVERLRKQLREVTTQRDKLSEQVKEWITIRQTEAEVALEFEKAQSESVNRAKDDLIQEITSQMARIEPMVESGRTSTLHFLTQDAANQAKHTVEKEVERLRGVIKDKDTLISQRDARIAELEQTVSEKDVELKLEIDRCSELQAKLGREPPAAARSRAAPDAAHNDPKNGAVIRLYEDMTNLLVTNIRIEKSAYFDLEDQTFSCVFTHNETKASLSFILERQWVPTASQDNSSSPPPPIKSRDQLSIMVRYTPLNLDKEPAEFKETIEFLGDVFTFSEDQMDVFFNSIRDYLEKCGQDNSKDKPIVVDDDGDKS